MNISKFDHDELKPLSDPTSEKLSGELLVERLKAGDAEGFETLVRQFGSHMQAAAHRILGNEHDASDAVQQAFLSAFKSITSFNGQAQLSTWLHRIVVNAALTQMRYRRRRPELPIDDLLPRFDEQGGWSDPNGPSIDVDEQRLEERDTRDLVRRAIDRLPEAYRSVLILRDIEELSTAVVAAMLAITPNAVKIRLHRARQALKTLIEIDYATDMPIVPIRLGATVWVRNSMWLPAIVVGPAQTGSMLVRFEHGVTLNVPVADLQPRDPALRGDEKPACRTFRDTSLTL
jgi:RNA polymerase sigma-70 factor, ECF subfamily